MGSETEGLPVINFRGEELKAEGGGEWRRTSRKVREALEEYGCFIAEYEGVSREMREEVLKAAKQLFDLPIETKKKNKYEKPFNGYVGELRTLPLHESLGIDDATNFNGVQSFTHLMWPSGNHHFRSFSSSSSNFILCLSDVHNIYQFLNFIFKKKVNDLKLEK